MMKSRMGALLVVCTALLFSASGAEASVKNKTYNVNGSFSGGPVFISISGATLATTSNSYTLSGGGIPASVSGAINSEQDFPAFNFAIANGTVSISGIGSGGSFTAIQFGQQIFSFGFVSGTVSGFPVFGFFSVNGTQLPSM